MSNVHMLKMDEIDRNIIQIIQEEPNLTHTQIAKMVNRSQPTVGMRIKKLEEAGVLKFQAGINIKSTDLILARAEIETSNPETIENLVKKCPFMLNAFRQSGTSNISVLIVAFRIQDVDSIVNFHFRNNPDVKKVVVEIFTGVVKDLVLPFNLNFEDCESFIHDRCCSKLLK